MTVPEDIRAVTLFVPCYVDYLHPQAGRAAVHLLEFLGHEVRVQDRATCCGQPLTNSGADKEGEAVTRAWYRAMEGAAAVVVLSASCTSHLKHHRTPQDIEIVEICEFLTRHHGDRTWGNLDGTVCLHGSCHGLRGSKSNSSAATLLDRIEGLNVLHPQRPDECCGFGGTFSTTFPSMSIAMGQDKLASIEQTGTQDVVATDISCLLHLQGIAAAQGRELRIRHVVEALDEARQ